MTVRILFLREGTSDDGIAEHIENIAAGLGIEVALTNPDLDRLNAQGHTIGDKLSRVLALGGFYELVAVHRDADNAGRQPRVLEIEEAVRTHMPGVVHVPVVPVRMTEAWLLVDEPAIRRVAGNPNGRCALGLPQASRVETIADPKKLLKQALAAASELSGRRLKRFNDRFPENRRQLLQRLDPNGPVTRLPSWQAFVGAVEDGLYRCGD
ncbi:hypothetical protein GCM10007079_06260 [Nocardiopsis terrae]|uniref:DUF4276 family protein n=1 Tax=Nocardiopsis terrae TaxID=372655 RepID=A0ABR9HNV5_9ACTN|nr:hypothetical protein [Nocardiopsis terrae]MBE1460673.1 hypothetical protein [Nocardiopsis terrae]GHC72811.1 hypothetical protein GCM10007079_06260 [Nocardiopsis terrae]